MYLAYAIIGLIVGISIAESFGHFGFGALAKVF